MLPLRYEPGEVVADRFEIVRPLSAGGMGVVFEVTQRGLGVRRALKVLRPELATLPAFRKRFEHEAWLGAQVQSPHVLEVLDAGFDANRQTPWILTELLTGEDLQHALDTAPCSRWSASKPCCTRCTTPSARPTTSACCTSTSSPPTSFSRRPRGASG
jgi:serine/threonine protein kinase